MTHYAHGPRFERRKSHGGRGFTLIELMVTITILGILLAWAVPSFKDASLSSRLTAFANDLVASAQIARSEAIKRNAPVTLCRSTNGTACAGSGGWEDGWIVLSGTTVLQRHAALPSDFRIAQGTFGALIFPPDVVGATAATFTVCRATPIGKQKRTVRITASGGTSVARVDSATTCP